MKLKYLFLFLISILFLRCAPNFQVVRWNADIYDNFSKAPYTFWEDGIEFITQQNDSISVNLSGSLINNYAYIFVSIKNNGDKDINLFPAKSKLIQKYKKQRITLSPVRPKEIRKLKSQKSSLISIIYATSVLANSIAFSNSRTIAEKIYYENRINQNDIEYNTMQEKLKLGESNIINLMLKNQTIEPHSNYYGYLLFPYLNGGLMKDYPFYLVMFIGEKRFIANGRFCNSNHYDELDLEEDLRKINFK